jgi:hypothetical protein
MRCALLVLLVSVVLGHADEVRLRNGDVLQGVLLGWVAGKGPIWKHPAVAAPVEIPLANIINIQLGQPEPAAADRWRIQLTDGDNLTGEIVALDADRLRLKTSYAGELSIERETVASIARGTVAVTNAADTVALLTNGDQVTGMLRAIRDGVVAFDTSYAAVKLPLEKLQSLTLPARATPHPALQPGEIIATLAGRARVTLTIEEWRDGHLIATGRHFGRARFSAPAIKTLQALDSRELKVRVFMDGSDSLHLRDDSVWFTHGSWKKPGNADDGTIEPTYIDGVAWNPEWRGETSDLFKLASLPSQSGRAEVEVVKARGLVEVTQQPTAGNHNETIIRIDDSGVPGQDWYEFVVRWSAGD